MHVADWAIGMRVITQRGMLARIDGMVIETHGDDKRRVNITYHNPVEGTATILVSLLSAYKGPPVIFDDERDAIVARYSRGVA